MSSGKCEVVDLGPLDGNIFSRLRFRSDRGGSTKPVVSNYAEPTAHLCNACGALVIPPEPGLVDALSGAAKRIVDYLKTRKPSR